MQPEYRIYYTHTANYFFLQKYHSGRWGTYCRWIKDDPTALGFVFGHAPEDRVQFKTVEAAEEFVFELYKSAPEYHEQLELVKEI